MVEKKPSLCWDELLRHQPQFICHCDFENCKTGRSDASAGNTFLLFSYMKGAERWNAVRSSEGIRLPCLWFPERRIPTTHSVTWQDFIRQPGEISFGNLAILPPSQRQAGTCYFFSASRSFAIKSPCIFRSIPGCYPCVKHRPCNRS